jgi:hypothetical protein
LRGNFSSLTRFFHSERFRISSLIYRLLYRVPRPSRAVARCEVEVRRGAAAGWRLVCRTH